MEDLGNVFGDLGLSLIQTGLYEAATADRVGQYSDTGAAAKVIAADCKRVGQVCRAPGLRKDCPCLLTRFCQLITLTLLAHSRAHIFGLPNLAAKSHIKACAPACYAEPTVACRGKNCPESRILCMDKAQLKPSRARRLQCCTWRLKITPRTPVKPKSYQ